MKELAAAMGLVLIAWTVCLAQTSAEGLKPDATTEQELRALRRDFQDALKRGDRATLERVLGDGFMFIHSTGVVETREEYINRAAAGAKGSPPGEMEFLDEKIRVYGGHTAVWTTRSVRRGSGATAELSFRGTDVLVKAGGRWQWVSVHSTRLPTRPKAAAIPSGASP